VVAQHLERLLLVDAVTFHQGALGPLGHGAASEGAFQGVVLGRALERDVDRVRELLEIRLVSNVREDAQPGPPGR
jgi:hypothetical protein